ncbi:hypothetical protein TIFTF001_038671 [Ficus carica]|uniref:Uncharacterized protein n=1 Tax=Ficus carica TaxID=3494 RepID=A0AA88EAY2_FICCA|nr:hypothetical protein TIFTF001_038671 [Ficus carica]
MPEKERSAFHALVLTMSSSPRQQCDETCIRRGLQDRFYEQVRMEGTVNLLPIRGKNLGMVMMPHSTMEGLIDKSLVDATENSDMFE